MGKRGTRCSYLGLLAMALPLAAHAAAITGKDSTQPRGAPLRGALNEHGQTLDPIVDGLRSPAYRAAHGQDAEYEDWAGTMLANATRDPSFYATLSVANRDLIDLVNSLPGDPADPSTPLGKFLADNELAADVSRGPDGRLEPETLLPIAADLCLRCHSPPGWMEGHSEPPTRSAPYLKGQFWGAAFLHHPADASGRPRVVDVSRESEAELEGVDCDFCHRVSDVARRKSRFDGGSMARGNGGFFVDRSDPFDEEVSPDYDVLGESEFCGVCHDVTNPLLKTATVVGGEVPDMQHPIERTYTEWYWSGYRGERGCQDCHEPMLFQGAQTWMIYPVLDLLWGKVDQPWREPPYEYGVPERPPLFLGAMERNRRFMRKEAADVELVGLPEVLEPGQALTVRVKVTNKTGHKLPTGFAEGRQAWIEIEAVDGAGKVLYADGKLDASGGLVRTPETKVYEQVVMAGRPARRASENRTCYEGYPFLDGNGDGCVDAKESHFHFVLMNYIEKDNRIPPKGYNKQAFTRDGAFIIASDPKDTDYADGQYWDVTPYRFNVPADVRGPLRVTATLWYQTFSREYVEFLREHDEEKTIRHGGRARNLPEGRYARHETWGEALYQLWKDAKLGPPVRLGRAQAEIAPAGREPQTGDPGGSS